MDKVPSSVCPWFGLLLVAFPLVHGSWQQQEQDYGAFAMSVRDLMMAGAWHLELCFCRACCSLVSDFGYRSIISAASIFSCMSAIYAPGSLLSH